MEHYDGPAFFRKYQKTNHLIKKWAQETPDAASIKPPKRVVPEKLGFQAAKKTTPQNRQPDFGPDQVVKTWSTSQPFRPTVMPKQRRQLGSNQAQVDYERLRQKFVKTDAQVLVFSDDPQGVEVVEPTKTTTPSRVATKRPATVRSQTVQPEEKGSDGQLSASAIAEKKAAAMERLKARAAAKHAKKTKQKLPKSATSSKLPTGQTTNQSGVSNATRATATTTTSAKPTSPQSARLPGGVGASDKAPVNGYHFPSQSLLEPPVHPVESQMDDWIQHQAEVLDETLKAFHVDAHVVDWTVGPTVTQFQISLALGVKVNKITNLTDDLKLALAAKDIRIEAPIPGRTTVGIEIPNLVTRPVMLSEVVQSDIFKRSASPLTVALGVDLFGKPQITDLRKMPHGLIAGATGSGKSVFINSLLLSLLYKATPAEVRLMLIDPKAVELAPYDGLPHLLSPVISDPKAAAAALKWAVQEMDERYEQLAAGGVRNIEQFNERAEQSGDYGLKMPYLVIVIDELADLMMTASSEVQDYIVRITQKARAAGIHLLVATQRPSVDIVTGVIKNNIPTRVAFMVSSQIDSRTILDAAGAERLLGRGDMLYLGNGASQAMRLQGTFVDEEVDRVTRFVRQQGTPKYAFDPDGLLKTQQIEDTQDDLMPDVLRYIVSEGTVSTSKLQRIFSIGYNRAANLIEALENNGYISTQSGSKPRDVILTRKQLEEMQDTPLD